MNPALQLILLLADSNPIVSDKIFSIKGMSKRTKSYFIQFVTEMTSETNYVPIVRYS